MKEKNWSVMVPWNKGLSSNRFDRRIEPRDFLFGSEIGKNMWEVYQSMNGIAPTNLASETAMRKMEAGNFYEAIVVWVLKRAGVLKETQTRVRLLDNPEYLNVYGRLDIVAGHDGDWAKTKFELNNYFEMMDKIGLDFPFFAQVKKISSETVDFLSEKYPDGLEEKIYEVKSINSMAFWRNDEPISQPYEHHIRQLTFYQLYHPVKVGSFLYIDRDTMSISELPNIVKEEVVKEIYDWLKTMTYHFRSKIEPAKPELIIWDAKNNKYSFNWEVDRSQYKDKLLESYGVKEGDINRLVNEKNKTLRRNAVIESALKGDTSVRGVKKYILAIDLLRQGLADEVVMKRASLTADVLQDIKTKL